MEKVQIIPPPKDVDPRMLVWKGAAVLAKMDACTDLWVTVADWVSLSYVKYVTRYCAYHFLLSRRSYLVCVHWRKDVFLFNAWIFMFWCFDCWERNHVLYFAKQTTGATDKARGLQVLGVFRPSQVTRIHITTYEFCTWRECSIMQSVNMRFDESQLYYNICWGMNRHAK